MYIFSLPKNLVGVDFLTTYHPMIILPLFTVGWFGKTEIYVLVEEPICPVQQNRHNFWTNDTILNAFRI